MRDVSHPANSWADLSLTVIVTQLAPESRFISDINNENRHSDLVIPSSFVISAFPNFHLGEVPDS